MDREYAQRYGVGISNTDYMGSAMNGHPNPNQAYAGFTSGAMSVPTHQVDMGQAEYSEDIAKPRKLKPILTRNGKILAAVIILSFAAYVVWKKHKAKQEAKAELAPADPAQPAEPSPNLPENEPAPEAPQEAPKTIQEPVSVEPEVQPEA
jgi:hypothetical protein